VPLTLDPLPTPPHKVPIIPIRVAPFQMYASGHLGVGIPDGDHAIYSSPTIRRREPSTVESADMGWTMIAKASQPTLGRWAGWCISVALALSLAQPCMATAQVPRTPQELRTIVRAAAIEAAKERGILADPRVLEEVTASVVIFAGNFCYPPDSAEGKERCQKTVNDPRVMAVTLGEFLREAVESRPSSIESVGSRLARRLGMEFTDTGWPKHVSNAMGVVEIPTTAQGASIALRTSAGSVELGVAGRVVVVAPGRVEMIAKLRSGSESSAVLQVAPRTRVTALFQTTAGTSENLVGGRVEPSLDLFCYESTPGLPSGPYAAFNWGRVRFGEPEPTREANQAPFTKQIAVDIDVVDQTGGRCDDGCRAGLGAAFAEAIAVWRSGCERCSPNALSVVRLGATVWVDGRIANRLRQQAVNPSSSISMDLRRREAGEVQTLVPAPAIFAPQTSIVGFKEISRDETARKALCELRTESAPWVGAAQALLCRGGGQLERGAMRPVVTLKPGATSCGPSSAFLACGLPGGGIELTVDDVRYAIPTIQGARQLGTSTDPPIDVRLVVLHEVGHWFGVPHAEVAGAAAVRDIMSTQLGAGKGCVSSHTMVMMNNAADLRWQYRVTAGHGLRRPSRTGSGRR
jgi:hypothetical protein